MTEITQEQLADALWRLTSGKIYQIRNKSGVPEFFVPNAAQKRVLKRIFIDGIRVLVIPKSRQRGLSTLISLIVLDALLFGTSVQTTLVDFNSQNAKKKLSEKVLFAFDRLEPSLHKLFKVKTRNLQTGEFSVGPDPQYLNLGKGEVAPFSTGFFGDQPRGGTNQILWLSEWSEIAARFPQRSLDIKTGAIPTAESGLIIIESTWYGGKRGDVWPFVKEAMETPAEERGPRTAWIEFFAWWGDADNREEGPENRIRPETLAYFKALKQTWADELKDVEFDVPQMIWYQQTALRLGIHMKSQHPSVLSECFEAPIRGAIWAEAIAKMRQEGRITNVPHDKTLEVDTFWDLGAPSNTAIKFVQHRGGMHHLISSQQGEWSDMRDLVFGLRNRGYSYGTHYIPHDGAQTARIGVTFEKAFRDELSRQGCSGRIVCLPRTTDIWVGINHTTLILGKTLVDKSCSNFIECAEAYRRKSDPQDDDKFLDEIIKDYTSHECDSFRTMAEADILGYLPTSGFYIATRPFFDPGTLAVASSDAAANPPRTVTLNCSDGPGRPVRHVTDAPDTGGWLRVWNGPQQGRRYLVTLIGRSLQVWQSDGPDGPMALQAAPPWIQQPDHSLFYRWAAQVSAFYGLAPIAVDVVSHPGGVQELRKLGSFLMARQQVAGKRPLGQEEATMHEGWEWNADVAQHALITLQGRIRTGKIVLACPSLVVQCQEIQNSTAGLPEWRDGVPVDLVKGAALASLCHDHASLFRAQIQQETGGHSITGDRRNAPGRMKNR